MKLFDIPRTKIEVLFRTRGEHRPPHVHVRNREVPWEARIRFSFVEDDDIVVLDIDPAGNAPSTAVIRKVLKTLVGEISLLRRRWWEAFGTTGLEGKWVIDLPVTKGQPQFSVLRGHRRGAGRAKSVTFDAATRRLMFTLEDARTFAADVGQGRDLSNRD